MVDCSVFGLLPLQWCVVLGGCPVKSLKSLRGQFDACEIFEILGDSTHSGLRESKAHHFGYAPWIECK